MLSISEIAIAAWLVISVGLAIWTYHDSWMLAFSRAWSVASLLFGPLGLMAYLIRSRVLGIRTNGSSVPPYELRHVDDSRAKAGGMQAHTDRAAVSVNASTVSDFETAHISQGLPRCPRCSTAVSYYDVKCMRCGQLIKPVTAPGSF